MQRNPHSYQIATGYRTFYSLSLIYQPITKKRLFLFEKLFFMGVSLFFSSPDYFSEVSGRAIGLFCLTLQPKYLF